MNRPHGLDELAGVAEASTVPLISLPMPFVRALLAYVLDLERSTQGPTTSDRWDAAYLRQCLDWAAMSKDPNTKVGSIIVGPDREVRACGFNGFPRGIADTNERLADRDLKNRLMVHAERNAICNAARIGTALKGCTLYLIATDDTGATWGGPPCTACTIEVIQAGIVEVVSLPFKSGPSKWAADIAFARGLLDEAGVRFREVASVESTPPPDFSAAREADRVRWGRK